MSLNPMIKAVDISPNPLVVNGNYIIKVTVVECIHGNLTEFTHNELANYRHREFGIADIRSEKLHG